MADKIKPSDYDCNDRIYREVLPHIAKAFCELAAEVSNNNLVSKERKTGEIIIMEEKARTMKDAINKFIDGQAEAWKTYFDVKEKTC